jgi:hypothetical protein
MAAAIVVLFVLAACANALVFDNKLSNRPVASEDVIFQIGMGLANQIETVVVYFGGTVHYGRWFGDYSYARANNTVVGVECKAGDLLFSRWADTSPAAEELEYVSITGPNPAYARPIYGPNTNQRFACRVPSDIRAKESEYGKMIHGPEGMFLVGSLYNGPACDPEFRRADVYAKTGLPVTNVSVLSMTVPVEYPHTHTLRPCVPSGVADGIYYKAVNPVSTVTLHTFTQSRGNVKTYHENDIVVWTALTIGFHTILGLISVTKLLLFLLCPNPASMSQCAAKTTTLP